MTSQDKAYQFIKELITDCTVKPNEQLVASDLATRLSISRTPVREALSRLEQDGLLERTGGWGYSVRRLRLTDVEELFKVREALEVMAVREALPNLDPDAEHELETLLQQASKCKPDSVKFISFNRAFYSTLASAARNSLLRSMLSSINDRVQMIGAMTVKQHGSRAAEVLAENRAVLDALRLRDSVRAEAAVREHIHRSRDYAVRMVARQGG